MSKFLDLTGLQSVVTKMKALLALKQDTLTAGSKIDITNNVIDVIGEPITKITTSSINISITAAGVYQLPQGCQIQSGEGAIYTTVSTSILFVDSKTGNMVDKAWYLLDGSTGDGRRIVYGYLQGSIGQCVQTTLDALERTSNKVTSLSSSSTNTQYPSAKLVYNQLALKEATENKVTSLSSSSTDTQYPSAKLTYDQLALKEATANKVTSLSSSSTDTQYPSAKAVYDAIDALPEPMVFKGSLGTGGTITALPVNGTANIGDTYKVITAGTYASKTAKVGDTFICLTKTSSANTWELIPSGDEPSGTVTSVTIKATSPIAIDSSSAITSSGTRTLSHANSGVSAGTYTSVTVNATGHVTGGTNPTTLSGYGITDAVAKSGDTMTGALTISSGDLIISADNIIRQTDYPKNHQIKMGKAGSNTMDFYEYGGVFNFIKSQNGTDTSLGSITTNGWEGKAALTGTPTAPTATAGTNTTQIATTQFVTTAVNAKQNKVTYSTTDLTAGTSTLATGEIYLVYE